MTLVASVLVSALAGPATSARATTTGARHWAKPWASRIATPRPRGVVIGGVVQVRAELAPGVRGFRAWVGDSKVTGAFRSGRDGRARTATLRVGETPGLGYGRHVLYIETFGAKKGQRWWAERHIVVARPANGLLKRASAKRVPGAGALLKVTTASPRTRVVARLGGSNWQPLAGHGRHRNLRFDGDLGLGPGVNKLAIRAIAADRGRYQAIRAKILMPRSMPVAGAGPDKRARKGDPVRFSAAGTNVSKGRRPRYHWRIVRRPAGSKARLRHVRSVHPILRPDKIGRYKLRLTVGYGGRRRAAQGSRAVFSGPDAGGEVSITGTEEPNAPVEEPNAPVEEPNAGTEEPDAPAMETTTSGEPEGGAELFDTDTATLEAVPADGPLGTPVDTITPNGIEIGGTHYAAPKPNYALQLLVLERATLAEVSNTSYTNEDEGTSELLAAVKSLTSADIAIIARPQLVINGNDKTANENIDKALAAIGVQPASQVVTNGETVCDGAEPCSIFSAIGIPGSPVGQGSLNDGLSGLRAPASGDLEGYFQENLKNEGFTFVSTERVPFDTGEPGADPAKVTVGSSEPGSPYPLHTYPSDTIPAGSSGFFVLILSAGNLGVYAEGTYTDNAAGLAAMHAELTQAAGERKDLVIVRSIGSVARVDTPAWDQVAEDLQKLGAGKYFFNLLNGTSSGQWAQVSPGGDPDAATYPDPDMQFASHEHSSSGRLTGLLGRDDLGQLYPKESVPANLEDSSQPLAGSLGGIMSLAPTEWPENAWTQGELNVEKCIAGTLTGFGKMRTPLRTNYDNESVYTQWADWATMIAGAGYFQQLAKEPGCGSFLESDFQAVEPQLFKEFHAVTTVWQQIDSAQKALAITKGESEVNSVALGVNKSVAGNEARPARFDSSQIASDALWALSTIPGLKDESDAINFIAASLGLASDLNQRANGGTAAKVTTKAVEFAGTLNDQIVNEWQYLGRAREILLSDPTKLIDTAQNAADTEGAAADWAWSDTVADEAVDSLMVSVRRQSYLVLFPTAYSLYRLQGGASALPSNPADYQCSTLYNGVFVVWSPFSSIQQQYGFAHEVVTAAGTTEDWTYAQSDTSPLSKPEKRVAAPSEALLAAILGPAKEEDPYQKTGTSLFNGAQFPIEAYADAAENTITVTHSSAGAGKRSTNLICDASGG